MSVADSKIWQAILEVVKAEEAVSLLEQQLEGLVVEETTAQNMTDDQGDAIRSILQEMSAARQQAGKAVNAALYDRSPIENRAAEMLGLHNLLRDGRERDAKRQPAKVVNVAGNGA